MVNLLREILETQWVTKNYMPKKIYRKSSDPHKIFWSRNYYSFDCVQIFRAIRADYNFEILRSRICTCIIMNRDIDRLPAVRIFWFSVYIRIYTDSNRSKNVSNRFSWLRRWTLKKIPSKNIFSSWRKMILKILSFKKSSNFDFFNRKINFLK